MRREDSLQCIQDRSMPWDMVVVGGGATGIGIALDAAVRGLSVLLLEQSDFGKGTSSRSTKLIHGGVRYLRQGNVSLVKDSLRERSRLQVNAPHLVHDLAFLVPCRTIWERIMYRVGFFLYDLLAGKSGFGKSRGFSRSDATELVSTIQADKLNRGGVVYHDGQFDDARLLIHMARTAVNHGACVLNYARVTELMYQQDSISGVKFFDEENDREYQVESSCVINATGPFCDSVRKMDDPEIGDMISPSQGVHIVLPREFLPGDTALIVPKTVDGRVLFLIPWYDHVVVGTTDTAISSVPLEPWAQSDEVRFLLQTASEYLNNKPTPDDVLSMFVGIRPLVSAGSAKSTSSLSRDHTIEISDRGLMTITGGKWTTVRKMAEDCVDRAIGHFGLPAVETSTVDVPIHGAVKPTSGNGCELESYGTDAEQIRRLQESDPALATPLHDKLTLTGAEVVWAAQHEMARTVEDVLARRSRSLFLNVQATLDVAPKVAELMALHLGCDQQWQRDQVAAFERVATHFQISRLEGL